MAFNGTEGTIIDKSRAKIMTDAYKAGPAFTPMQGQEAIFFGKDKLMSILNQSNCVGLRIYYGINPEGNKPNMVVVGTDAAENDIVDTNLIMDLGVPCPDKCSSIKF